MATFRTSRPVSLADPAVPHVILVGLPGAGKSAVGTLLAHSLGRTFLDLDLEISRREGMSIAEIFAQRGEPYFRDLEHRLTAELREFGNMVVAPGGGWITRPDTVALLRPPARMLYLKVTPGTAVRRMGGAMAGRPLLTHPDPEAELARLLSKRKAWYEAAEFVVDVERLSPQQVTKKLIDWLAR